MGVPHWRRVANTIQWSVRQSSHVDAVVILINSPAKKCEMLRWTCLYVFGLCLLAYFRNQIAEFTPKFDCLLLVAVAQSFSGGVAVPYVLPVSWITSYLHTMIRNWRCENCTCLEWFSKESLGDDLWCLPLRCFLACVCACMHMHTLWQQFVLPIIICNPKLKKRKICTFIRNSWLHCITLYHAYTLRYIAPLCTSFVA